MDKYYYAGFIFVYAVPKSLLEPILESTLEILSVTVKKCNFVLSGFLLLVAVDSMAMSLGRYRGAAIIGRPLDVYVQATLDAQDDSANACVEADVFYSDRRLAGSAVRATLEKTGSGPQELLIRIRASVPIDEPVVMVYLRAGCQQKTERRYVLLADLLSETDTPLITLPIAGSTAVTPTPRAPFAPPSNTPALADRPVAKSSTARSTRGPRVSGSTGPVPAGEAAADVAKAAPTTTTTASPAKVAVPSTSSRGQRTQNARGVDKSRARLKLEPLDLTVDRDPTLKSSPELLSAPAATEQERSVAAALWRALTAQPQDILRDSERLQTLENSVRKLQVQSQKNQLAVTELNGQLQQARSERYANVLVYALCALLLAAIAAVVYLLRQRGLLSKARDNELPWWRKNKLSEKGWADSGQDDGISNPPNASALHNKGPNKDKPKRRTALDIDLDLGMDESSFTEVKHLSGHGQNDSLSQLSSRDRSDFALSMTHMARAVKAEELFDVQQQADFFVSLGQHDQAIEVLRSHISDNAQTSALIYLDLVDLYHELNRKAEYEALREDFNKLFNAKVPAFELYSDSSPGLESYQAALSRIEALWPSPKVLDIIEESIFRKPDTNAEAFDLGAYRELLLLYAVAKEIISPEADRSSSLLKFDLPHSLHDDDVKTSKFVATSIQPLSARVALDEPHQPQEMDVLPLLPNPSPRLGLDVDLSDAFGSVESPDAEPESDSRFFEQFAGNVVDDTPVAAASTSQKQTSITDNLIDFDSFDSVMDMAARKKPPRA